MPLRHPLCTLEASSGALWGAHAARTKCPFGALYPPLQAPTTRP